ncbi:DUF222 domain-containing protein [Microbacterium fluvii]|uniref:DUF222 domain-containing protein n=1 Tax=Microbacterium fluvii TaxID=415215 RepID=A0ABW2HAP8_9MICO|nr:HNH endonuclease signature motif containing protein [Microbacterium fluvii]MCU4671151.1 HNH endonuclease [Microbacterium fluvii]
MNDSFTRISELACEARELMGSAPVEGIASATLMRLNDIVGRLRRHLDAAHAPLAAELARQSRPELGADSLARKQGFRNAKKLIAATTGTTLGEATRIVQVGEATAPRRQLSGVDAPARHPHVAAALDAGAIGSPAASAIITMLDRVALRAGADAVAEAERLLVEKAPGPSLEDLQRILQRAEAWLDPDGVAPSEDELRADRYLHMHEDRFGALILKAKFDPERGAPIKVALEAFVAAELRAARDREANTGAAFGLGSPASAPGETAGAAADRRTIPQMQADALAIMCEHVLGCEHRDLPIGGATVVVRMNLEDLEAGTGHATIDGLAAPVSIATARRMAADAQIIPCVLGGESEILDWGRAKRLFTRAQKLALAERDGGCARCGAPISHTKVHHIHWWRRDGGRTDLGNGVLLCDGCHHDVHDNGWEIRIEGVGVSAWVWFIPPPWVDPDRTPQLGGRRRFDWVT